MRLINYSIFLLLIILLFQGVNAQVQTGHGNTVQDCDSFTVTAVAAVLSAGTFHFCNWYPSEVSSSSSHFEITTVIDGPALLGATPTITFGVAALQGCTVGSIGGPLGAGTAAFGTQRSWHTDILMTSNQCAGFTQIQLSSAAVTIYAAFLDFNVHSLDIINNNANYLCEATGAASSAFNPSSTTCMDPNIRTYLCDSTISSSAVIASTECTTPDIGIYKWPSLQTDTQSKRSGDVQFETNPPLILASDTGSDTVNLIVTILQPSTVTTGSVVTGTPTVETVNGGNAICTVGSATTVGNALVNGEKLFIHTRPVTFDADYCRLSGTYTLQTAGGTFIGQQVLSWTIYRNVERLSGQLNTVMSGSLGLTGTISVVNSGGQTLAISSWPVLLSTLSGGITITDDANGWAIHQDALSGTVNVVNSGGQTIEISDWPTLVATLNGDLNIHQDEACGATINCHMICEDGSCMSNLSNINVTNTGNTTMNTDFNIGLVKPILILLAIAFFVIMAESKNDALYWFVATILSIYLLINRGNSVIPVSVYVGWIFITLYQAVSLLSNVKSRNLSGKTEE